MDNLVDIDALLGDLELESDEVEAQSGHVGSSSNNGLGAGETSMVELSSSGCTARSTITNGTNSLMSTDPKSHGVNKNYMDDLLDISFEPDFGPALSSLQTCTHSGMDSTSQLQSLPSGNMKPKYDLTNPVSFVEAVTKRPAVSNPSTHSVSDTPFMSSSTITDPTSEESSRRKLETPALVNQYERVSKPSDIWGINSQSVLSGTGHAELLTHNDPDILGHHLRNGEPDMVLQLNEATSSFDNSTDMKNSNQTGSDHNELTSLSSFIDNGLISPLKAPSLLPSNSSVDGHFNFLPLTEDLSFLTNYEQQQSNGNHMESIAASNDTSNMTPISYEGGVTANAPSLGQFSSEFSLPSNTNSDTPFNNAQSPMKESIDLKPAAPSVNLFPSGQNNQPDTNSALRVQANSKDHVSVSNPFLENTGAIIDSQVLLNTEMLGNEKYITEPERSHDSINGFLSAGQPSLLLSSKDSTISNHHSKEVIDEPQIDDLGGNRSTSLTEDLGSNMSTSPTEDLGGNRYTSPTEDLGGNRSTSLTENLSAGRSTSLPENLTRSATTQPDLLDDYGSESSSHHNSSSHGLMPPTELMDAKRSQHQINTSSNSLGQQHIPDILTSATPEPPGSHSGPYDIGGPDTPTTNLGSGARYKELSDSEFYDPQPYQNFHDFPLSAERTMPSNEYNYKQSLVSTLSDPYLSSHQDSNPDEEFNSLLASNGYPIAESTNKTYGGSDQLNGTNLEHTPTSQMSASNPMASPMMELQKNTAVTGSMDSFTKLQNVESQQTVESFTALHNMSVSQSHRNSLLEQNGILPGAEVQDMGWDIGATHSAVADDVFADLGLDEPITVSASVKADDFGYMDELPPGELPPGPRLTGFVEEDYGNYTEEPTLRAGGLVTGDFSSGPMPTTADLQSMVVQEDLPEPEVPDSPHPTDMMDVPVDLDSDIPPPPPYQLTDPAFDHPGGPPLGQAPVPHSLPTPQPQGYDVNSQSNNGQESNEYLDLGATKPYWIPDLETSVCMDCENKFTLLRRRHHCRCCGKIFCDTCCNMRSRLQYMDFREARVCRTCHTNIALAAEQQARLLNSQTGHAGPIGAGLSASPQEENGAVGGADTQAITPTPTGVLKDTTTNNGIRPGDENSHLDGSDVTPSSRIRRKVKGRQKTSLRLRETLRNTFLIPDTTLPPLLCYDNDSSQYSVVDSEPDEQGLVAKLREERDDGRFAFAIHKDLNVEIRIVDMDCCTSRQCWCFTSHGLNTVSQDEVVLLLECLPDENSIPRDIFYFYKMLYQQAAAGQQVTELGYADLSLVSPFDGETGFLGSKEHVGLLFIRATFQCLKGLCLPDPPYLFAILIHRLEIPWARLFPVRLKLRLGAEFKYYPCPLMSVRGREPVYREINNTIMNLLADFHTYKYSLNKIEGFTVHLMDRVTTISIPKNMYPAVMKVVGASQECVIAFGASFSTQADSHIVCMQNANGSYQSRTMNIRDQQRSVTGASFVVFSGSMKESYGLPAKCSIVEDGIMVQVTKEALDEFKAKLNNMQEYTVSCGRTEEGSEQSEQVKIVWVDDYKEYNIGVVSPIDGFPMDGVMSLRVKSFNDLTRDSFTIRWTEVFFVQVDESRLTIDTVEITQFSETIANSTGSALAPFLSQLHEHGMKKIALRVTLGPEQVEYICGSLGQKLKPDLMNNLDGELVPVLHSATSIVGSSLLVLELIFHVLE